MITAIAIATMLLAAGECQFEPEFVALFKPMEFRFTGGELQDQAFHYQLFDPRTEDSDADSRFPLIVWLHGFGEQGQDNVSQLRWLDRVMPEPWERKQFPFFVLAVQCPRNNRSWSDGQVAREDDMLSVTAAILDETLDDYPIDRQRVSLAGVSAAADGCWIFASRRPEYFSAVAPMSGGGFRPTAEQIASLKQMPIWVFHVMMDRTCPIEPVRQTVETLTKAGVNVHLSELEEGENHDSWTAAFGDYNLRDWLLGQRRSDSSARSNEIISWHREIIGFSRALVRSIGDFFFDLFCRWKWIQLPFMVYLAVVLGVVSRWMFKRVRIVRRKTRAARVVVEAQKD